MAHLFKKAQAFFCLLLPLFSWTQTEPDDLPNYMMRIAVSAKTSVLMSLAPKSVHIFTKSDFERLQLETLKSLGLELEAHFDLGERSAINFNGSHTLQNTSEALPEWLGTFLYRTSGSHLWQVFEIQGQDKLEGASKSSARAILNS